MCHTPASTYRLQFHKGFTLDDAAGVAGYLRDLGVTHIYSSPLLQAAPGSTHGYDVADHRFVNAELGGEAAQERFCKRLSELGLRQILDIVPNHMSLVEQNRYWWDVLENGHGSRYATYFDIDWESFEPQLRDKVLLPILPDHYGRVLADGGIVLQWDESVLTVTVGEHRLPVSPQGVGIVLERAAKRIHDDALGFLATCFCRLPSPELSDRRGILARDREKTVLARFLKNVCMENRSSCEAIGCVVAETNADSDILDAVLTAQNYRLAYWKTADQQLSYRRFFNVNELIGLRVEREYVFEETHALIFKWLANGTLDGVRVDHPDGLRDPKQYFLRLRERASEAWILGEKILEPGEELPADWSIQGTTGYEFMNLALGLLLRPGGVHRLGEHYASFTGDTRSFAEVSHAARVEVTCESLGSDVNRLSNIFAEICESRREQRDFTRADIRNAIGEVAACFPVYRTYVVPDGGSVTECDRRYIATAIQLAKTNRADVEGMLFDFIGRVLTLEVTGRLEGEFVYRFQQFTSPVMAKGVEDCAFYRYNRLVALNEVGGDPASEGVSVEQFHTWQRGRQKTFPTSMVSLSTHDTKRSDDVRARLAVLTEVPDAFGDAVKRWNELGAAYRSEQIDRGTEWFLYQTIVGAWPISADRLSQYVLKAMREAKVKTSWTANNSLYEEALKNYVDGLLADAEFTASVERFVSLIDSAGQRNSLTQTLLKYTAPGVPDLYQGSELWDFSLVDPDNRRPVDYSLRRRLLKEIKEMNVDQVMARAQDGLPKLWTIRKALEVRREHPEWFGEESSYTALVAEGVGAERVVAFLRGQNVVAVAARWFQGGPAWGDTVLRLPDGRWANCMSGETSAGGTVDIESLLLKFPVALLVREGDAREVEVRNA
jgi:(1->4)-alpha-D-glucan 1-alpha-D-glucosylmutase